MPETTSSAVTNVSQPIPTPVDQEPASCAIDVTSADEDSRETVQPVVPSSPSDPDEGVWDSPFDDELILSSDIDVRPTPAYQNADFAEDQSDLLQAEVEYLRSELVERDARIADLSRRASRSTTDQDEELPSREEV